tara:strand:- start:581 stop:1555 length:975 start_codon:yes stop_codon:yes gene_type:complete
MGSKTTYNAPKVEKDDSFEKYLEYQKERETKLEERAQAEREATAARDLQRRQTGAKGLTGLYDRTKSQLESGLLSYEGAQNQLQSYIDKYDLNAGFQPDAEGNTFDPGYTDPTKGAGQYLSNLQNIYGGEGGLLEQKRTAGINLAYQDLLGRQATEDELSGAMSNLQLQAYGGAGIQGLRDSIKSGSEYTKNINDNYLDNYYDVQYGKQTKDAEGNMTGKRIFNFDASLMPSYAGDLKESTGVDVTTGEQFSDYFSEGRTIAELEAQQQNIKDTRQFLFSAGLTNLQGDIDKETQKIKNEGAKDIAKIQQEGSIYGQLLGGFNF